MRVILDDSSLKAAANSVRSLSGETKRFFPSELSAAIDGTDCLLIRERDSSGHPVTVDASHLKIKNIPAYYFGASTTASNLYSEMKEITLSDDVQVLENYVFYTDVSLSGINLPEQLMSIGVRCFCGCKSLKSVEFPCKIRSISSNAFQNCTGLEKVIFPNLPLEALPKIEANAFSGCTALAEISVPWGEGAVAGAPWGAVNSDIIYNCQQ